MLAGRPIKVFINGREQREGPDYSVHGREIVFSRPIVKERGSSGRWLAMTLGLFGSYCDVQRAPRSPSFQPRYRNPDCGPKRCLRPSRL